MPHPPKTSSDRSGTERSLVAFFSGLFGGRLVWCAADAAAAAVLAAAADAEAVSPEWQMKLALWQGVRCGVRQGV